MKVSIGSDHRGFDVKKQLIEFLEKREHLVVDKGCFSSESVDYPVIAQSVATSVLSQESDCGVLFCGTGIGVSIAANRFLGVRAALCHDMVTTEFARKHNDANVFCFGVLILEIDQVKKLLAYWLDLKFDKMNPKNQRHVDRIKQIDLKKECC